MTTTIDPESQNCLRKLRGQVIQRIVGRRYPGVVGYSEVRILTTSKESYVVTLRIVDVAEDMEVCVPEVRPSQGSLGPDVGDCIEVGDFRVAKVFVLQRREDVEPATSEYSDEYVGANPREHRLIEIDSSDWSGAELVDAGLALVGEGGVSLELYADSFPLIFQLRLTLASSAVPVPRRVGLT